MSEPAVDTGTAGLSASALDSDAAREWLREYDHASAVRGWHPADVEWTLERAHKLLSRLGSKIGPSSGKGWWPAIVKEAGDYQEATKQRRVSAREVSTMNAALGWAWAFLGPAKGAPDTRQKERSALQLWCFCKENGVPYKKLLRESGRTATTEHERRQRATFLIAAALCRLEARIPREVLLARLERAKSEMRDDRDALAVEAQVAYGPETPPAPTPDTLPSLDELWAQCAVDLEPIEDANERDDAITAFIFARVALEANVGAIKGDRASLFGRHTQLTADAFRRGLMSVRARRLTALSREDLAARLAVNKEASAQ